MRLIFIIVSTILMLSSSGIAGEEFIPEYTKATGWKLYAGQAAAVACVLYACRKIWQDWKDSR